MAARTNKLKVLLSVGSATVGEYTLRTEPIDGGYRLTITRGGEVQTLDLLNGEKGEPGQDAPQEAVLYTPQTLTDAQKAQARENVSAADAQSVGQLDQRVSELQFDAAAFGIPILHLSGDTAQMSKDNAVTLEYAYGERTGTLTCKWQGSSSLYYPKKNFTVNFDVAFEAKSGWGVHSKYCLKANWVDASNLRNLFGAVIWGQMVKDRSGADPRLTALPNGGAIDGFPVWVIINGEDQGIYTWNIPKDAWMFGMTGSEANEGIVSAEYATFEGTAICDGTDFSVEYASGDDPAELIASLNNLITAVNNVQSADDLPSLEALIDVNSVIDYWVFMASACHNDGVVKNYLLGTYDGTKWFISAYDMDACFGNAWDGSGYSWASSWPMFSHSTENKLLNVVKTYYPERIKNRYNALRGWILYEASLHYELYKIAIGIPKLMMDEDSRLWPTRPGTSTNNIGQIKDYMRIRFMLLDYNVTTI